MRVFDGTIQKVLNEKLQDLEKEFDSDIIFFYGPIYNYIEKIFRDFIEKFDPANRKKRLTIFLNTPGGSVEVVDKMVKIIRHHYPDEVYFVVPDYAMSAGTILCMSGNKIFMDYSSSLGPIDPQVYNGKEWVPALGYLDKIEAVFAKSEKGELLTEAEMLILNNQDLARLSRFEQARNLTVTLLKKWLVDYKFKDWVTHQSDPQRKGQPVTMEEKKARSEEIAIKLGNNKHWHSHSRMIGIRELTDECKLLIDDYTDDKKKKDLIRDYNDLITEYIVKNEFQYFLHSKHHPREW